MEFFDRRKFFPLICISAFVLCVLLSALIGSMVITGDIYFPAVPNLTSLPLFESANHIARGTRSSAFQLLVLFISGFTAFAPQLSLVIMAYRGICFGYTAVLVGNGSLVFSKKVVSVFSLVSIDTGVVVLILYVISTAGMALMAYLALCRFDVFLRQEPIIQKATLQYILSFGVISGAVFLCDILKVVVLHLL